MDGPSPRSLASLMRAVAVLALPAADQIAWLDSLGIGGTNVDELALELGDGFLLVPQFVDRNWLPVEAVEPLRALDSLLASMSGATNRDSLLASMSGATNRELWETSALDTAPEWDRARALAKAALLTVT